MNRCHRVKSCHVNNDELASSFSPWCLVKGILGVGVSASLHEDLNNICGSAAISRKQNLFAGKAVKSFAKLIHVRACILVCMHSLGWHMFQGKSSGGGRGQMRQWSLCSTTCMS